MKEAKGRKPQVATENRKAVEKKNSLSVKGKAPKQSRAQVKAKKDPNQPKKPPTAFFVFLEEFRKTFKAENPNIKSVTAVGKACGDKWKKMSEEEKAPYSAKAAQMRVQYDKSMTAYKKKKDADDEAALEESEKAKSEVNDEEYDDMEDESEEEDDDDDE